MRKAITSHAGIKLFLVLQLFIIGLGPQPSAQPAEAQGTVQDLVNVAFSPSTAIDGRVDCPPGMGVTPGGPWGCMLVSFAVHTLPTGAMDGTGPPGSIGEKPSFPFPGAKVNYVGVRLPGCNTPGCDDDIVPVAYEFRSIRMIEVWNHAPVPAGDPDGLCAGTTHSPAYAHCAAGLGTGNPGYDPGFVLATDPSITAPGYECYEGRYYESIGLASGANNTHPYPQFEAPSFNSSYTHANLTTHTLNVFPGIVTCSGAEVELLPEDTLTDGYEDCGSLDIFCHLRNGIRWLFVPPGGFDAYFSEQLAKLDDQFPFSLVTGFFDIIGALTGEVETALDNGSCPPIFEVPLPDTGGGVYELYLPCDTATPTAQVVGGTYATSAGNYSASAVSLGGLKSWLRLALEVVLYASVIIYIGLRVFNNVTEDA